MFELVLKKEQLLNPLLTVAGAVDKKHAKPILSNILIQLEGPQLLLTATDLEIEITARILCEMNKNEGEITVPAKKIVDIIRSLDENASPTLICKENGFSIKEGRSQFKLITLPAQDYPKSKDEVSEIEFHLSRDALLYLLQSTHFAMSQHDVRVFLNGLLLEIDSNGMTAIATDGHRMAIAHTVCATENQPHKLLLPKKGVHELLRLLNHVTDETISIAIGKNHFKALTHQYAFLSKLIEARFPPYRRAVPKNQDKEVIIERDLLKKGLSRIMILAHEKSRAVLLHLQPSALTLIATNQDQEEAVETLDAQIQGEELKIGVNAGYLLDVLNYMEEGLLRLSFSNGDSSILVESLGNESYQYIIMPMKI